MRTIIVAVALLIPTLTLGQTAPLRVNGLQINSQSSTGIASGSVGIWNNSGTIKLRLSGGTDTPLVLGSRQVLAGTGLSGGGALTSDVTLSLPNVGAGAGTLGGSTVYINSLTVDAQGRITAITTGTPAGGGGGLTGTIAANQVIYGASTTTVASSANFTFDGTTWTHLSDGNGSLVGKFAITSTAAGNVGAWMTLDNSGQTSGRKWSLGSGGSGTTLGAGTFYIADSSVPTYRFCIDSTGQYTFKPGNITFDVSGGIRGAILYGGSAGTSNGAVQLDDTTGTQIVYGTKSLTVDGSRVNIRGGATLRFPSNTAAIEGAAADGSSAVGVSLDNTVSFSNATSKYFSFRNGGTEQAWIDGFSGNGPRLTFANTTGAAYVTHYGNIALGITSLQSFVNVTGTGVILAANGLQVVKAINNSFQPTSTQVTQLGDAAAVFTDAWSRHYNSASSAVPTNTPGTGAGTSPTVTITGNDTCGTITILTGTTPSASAAVVTVTFNTAYINSPIAEIQPANTTAGALTGTAAMFVKASTTSTTKFDVYVGSTALTAATTYVLTYRVGG